SFTPLMSPALTPQVNFHQLSLSQPAHPLSSQTFTNLSPLNSPAIQAQEGFDFNDTMNFHISPSGNDYQGNESSSASTMPTFSNSPYQLQAANLDGSVTPLTLVPLTPSQMMQLQIQPLPKAQTQSTDTKSYQESGPPPIQHIERGSYTAPVKRPSSAVGKRRSYNAGSLPLRPAANGHSLDASQEQTLASKSNYQLMDDNEE
ncbi:hypothetical protein HDU91_007457, partial [Kappamyces sp. JEL0680]